jgi:hypothetical protein
MYLYLCNPLLKNGKLFKYFAGNLALFTSFFCTQKVQVVIINLVEIKKPLHLHSQLKMGSNKRLKDL